MSSVCISTFQYHAQPEVLNSFTKNEWMEIWGQLQTQSSPLSQAPGPFIPLQWVECSLEKHWASEKWNCISSLSKCPDWLLSQEYFPQLNIIQRIYFFEKDLGKKFLIRIFYIYFQTWGKILLWFLNFEKSTNCKAPELLQIVYNSICWD